MTKIFPTMAGALVAAMALAQGAEAQTGHPGGHAFGRAGPARAFRPFDRAHRRFHARSRFRENGGYVWGWPYGWGYEPAEETEATPPPPYPPLYPPPPAAQAPVCPALWHWDAKHGRAIRENLCD